MKTLLLFTLALALAAAGPSLASAGCGGNKGGGNRGGYGGGFGGGFGGDYNRNQGCTTNYGNYGGGFPTDNFGTGGQAFEPFHSAYFVQPGDTFFEVSLKEYGTRANAQHIARFNQLQLNSALVPGQLLILPSISRTGVLTASRAPAPQGIANPTANFATPQAAAPATPATGINFATSDANLPSVSVGSTLSLDGVQFGDAIGSVRLKLGPISVPATVIEWNVDSVKVQLPSVDLDSATPASIEVFRADGTVASQSKVKLTPAGTQVARTE